MRRIRQIFVLCFPLTLLSFSSFGQLYWKDVAHIFYDHCATCHRPSEIGSDYLNAMGYSVLINSPFFFSIPIQTDSGLMPPWKADPNYSHFLDERILSQTEKDLIAQWIYDGAQAGDTTLAPDPPVFPSGSQLGVPDLTLTMSEPYTVPGDDSDHYICFVLPTNLLNDQNVTAIEFRPGNATVVHHAFIYITDDSAAVYKDLETPEYGYPSFGGAGVNADFLSLYAPGMIPRFYPPGSGVNFKAGSFLIIQVHYAPISVAETDQSQVNLFFTPDSVRKVYAKKIGEGYITNPPFKIFANEVDTFYSEFPVTTPASLFAIAPHQHLLGKSFKIWVITPDNDSIPLISIPLWDFHWQLLYSYPFMVKLPDNSIIHAMAVYDNTIYNPNNPHNPPENVVYGESSEDEMFKYFLNSLEYQPGDEDIVLDSNWIATAAPPIEGIVATPQLYSCSPNPAIDETYISYYLPQSREVSFFIYDLSGKLVQQINLASLSGLQRIKLNVSTYENGIYFCTMKASDKRVTKKFIVDR